MAAIYKGVQLGSDVADLDSGNFWDVTTSNVKGDVNLRKRSDHPVPGS